MLPSETIRTKAVHMLRLLPPTLISSCFSGNVYSWQLPTCFCLWLQADLDSDLNMFFPPERHLQKTVRWLSCELFTLCHMYTAWTNH